MLNNLIKNINMFQPAKKSETLGDYKSPLTRKDSKGQEQSIRGKLEHTPKFVENLDGPMGDADALDAMMGTSKAARAFSAEIAEPAAQLAAPASKASKAKAKLIAFGNAAAGYGKPCLVGIGIGLAALVAMGPLVVLATAAGVIYGVKNVYDAAAERFWPRTVTFT